jgi:hypothetical protein
MLNKAIYGHSFKNISINITLLFSTFLMVTFYNPSIIFAAPGVFKSSGGQTYCGSLTTGASLGGACDTSIHTANYRGGGLGQNICRILVCAF